METGKLISVYNIYQTTAYIDRTRIYRGFIDLRLSDLNHVEWNVVIGDFRFDKYEAKDLSYLNHEELWEYLTDE